MDVNNQVGGFTEGANKIRDGFLGKKYQEGEKNEEKVEGEELAEFEDFNKIFHFAWR